MDFTHLYKFQTRHLWSEPILAGLHCPKASCSTSKTFFLTCVKCWFKILTACKTLITFLKLCDIHIIKGLILIVGGLSCGSDFEQEAYCTCSTFLMFLFFASCTEILVFQKSQMNYRATTLAREFLKSIRSWRFLPICFFSDNILQK